MSWDVYIQDFGEHKKLEDIPEDFKPKSIGVKSEIINKIKEISPELNISDNSLLKLEKNNFSIDFSIGEHETLDYVMLHIRGDKSVFGYIIELITKLNLRAVDTSTGEFIDISKNPGGLELWKEYKDRILKDQKQN